MEKNMFFGIPEMPSKTFVTLYKKKLPDHFKIISLRVNFLHFTTKLGLGRQSLAINIPSPLDSSQGRLKVLKGLKNIGAGWKADKLDVWIYIHHPSEFHEGNVMDKTSAKSEIQC